MFTAFLQLSMPSHWKALNPNKRTLKPEPEPFSVPEDLSPLRIQDLWLPCANKAIRVCGVHAALRVQDLCSDGFENMDLGFSGHRMWKFGA